ncbi:MAG: 4Fe-4S binding protein [Pseudomonadales bacterium]|nr:4Fe-4S binding protein [Pseudomonadales bacterium]
MTHVIAAPCVADYSCVEVCPVDCISPEPDDEDFREAEQMYIDPAVCIDCGACVDVCPVLAIYDEIDLPEKWLEYIRINQEYFTVKRAGGDKV